MDPDVLDRLLRESQTGGEIQPATLKEVLDHDREELRRLAQALLGDEKTGAPTLPSGSSAGRSWPAGSLAGFNPCRRRGSRQGRIPVPAFRKAPAAFGNTWAGRGRDGSATGIWLGMLSSLTHEEVRHGRKAETLERQSGY